MAEYNIPSEIVKDLNFGGNAKDRIMSGVVKLCDAVESTLGASGRCVIYEDQTGKPVITKDGVTVAESVFLMDSVENMGASLIKEAARNTVREAGDGPQPLHSKVLTPKGWTTMGELSVGDEICGSNGTTQNVLEIYDKGELGVFEVKFSDGRVVECSENHLWSVTDSNGREKTLTVRGMIEAGFVLNNSGNRHFKFYVKNTFVEFDDNSDELELDPYFLGVMIGDGSFSTKKYIELSIGKNKEYILKNIKLPLGISYSERYYDNKNYYKVTFSGCDSEGNYLYNHFDNLGLLGRNSHTKFIPDKYLYSSKKNRELLLQGIIDTDGYINNRGLFEFSSVNETLANQVIELMQGLGIPYSYWVNKKRGEDAYSQNPIHRISQLNGYKYGLKIVDIVNTGRNAQMKCIKVSNDDHLYVTDDYVLTHNTSTSSVLARYALEKLMDYSKDYTIRELKEGMSQGLNKVNDYLESVKIEVDDEMLKSVATISCNNDEELGSIIGDAFAKVGKDGIVIIEESQDHRTYADVVDGVSFDSKLKSQFLITDRDRGVAELENPLVLLSLTEIPNARKIQKILEHCISSNRALLIIAPVSKQVSETLLMNKVRGNLKVNYIDPAGFGQTKPDTMEDLAILTGAKVYNEELGDDIDWMRVEDLGEVHKSVTDSKGTVLATYEYDESVDERKAQVKKEIENCTNDFLKKKLEQRLAMLSGKVGVVYVGADSNVEYKEKKDRVEDAVYATKAALNGGIVSGGGVALRDASKVLDRSNKGEDALYYAINKPLEIILKNASIEGTGDNIKEGFGTNAINGEIVNMVDAKIIDPLLVTKTALKNAVSVATTIVSADCVISNVRDYSKGEVK